MNLPGSWAKAPGKALDAAKLVEFTPETLALAKEGQPAKGLFDLLLGKDVMSEAIKLAAAALPRREGLWWGLLCARAGYGQTPPAPAQAACLQAVERWVAKPADDLRRACEKAYPLAKTDNPAGLLGLATFMAEGSIAPADSKHEVPAPGPTCPRVLYAAVILASIWGDATKMAERQKQFLGLANDVANGTNRWKEAPR